MEYYSAIKENEILPFATAWMDLGGIMLSEVSQSEKDNIAYYLTYMQDLQNKINQQNRNRLRDAENKLRVAKGQGDWGTGWRD